MLVPVLPIQRSPWITHGLIVRPEDDKGSKSFGMTLSKKRWETDSSSGQGSLTSKSSAMKCRRIRVKHSAHDSVQVVGWGYLPWKVVKGNPNFPVGDRELRWRTMRFCMKRSRTGPVWGVGANDKKVAR